VIAGNRPLLNAPLSWPLPKPHDGMVSVASTHVEGETDHLILPSAMPGYAGIAPSKARSAVFSMMVVFPSRLSRDKPSIRDMSP